MNPSSGRIALVAGATGAVGACCVEELLSSSRYSKVVALSRSPLSRPDHPKLVRLNIDFDRLEEYRDLFRVDDVFCCLGTIAQKTRSLEEYRKIDVDYPGRIAGLAHAQGAQRYLMVTAAGANPASRFYYLRFKGEAEQRVCGTPFESVDIFRPGLITAVRKEFRLNETAAVFASRIFPFLFIGRFAKYRPIPALAIARAMVRQAERARPGIRAHEGPVILELSELEEKK